MNFFQHLTTILLFIILLACGGTSDKQLISAAYNGKTKTLEQAIIAGGDVNTVSSKEGVNLLAYAAGAGHAATVSMLLMHGAHINKSDNSGWAALHFATSNGHLDVVELLLVMQADINAKTADGWTPLMYAVFAGHTEITQRLVEQGADTLIELSDGLTAAEIARNKGFDHLLPILHY